MGTLCYKVGIPYFEKWVPYSAKCRPYFTKWVPYFAKCTAPILQKTKPCLFYSHEFWHTLFLVYPISKSGYPLSKRGYSIPQSVGPILQSGYPILQRCYPISKSEAPISQSGYPISQSVLPLFHGRPSPAYSIAMNFGTNHTSYRKV